MPRVGSFAAASSRPSSWKASGHVDPPQTPDFAMLSALTLWGAVLIVVMSLLVDFVVVLLDPRIRAQA